VKVAHWTIKNGSGLHTVSEELAEAERALGIESVVQASDIEADWEGGMDADVHVAHSHIPDKVRLNGGKIVWIGHGTPEHCFHTSVEAGLGGSHGFPDTVMLIQHWFQIADALVTFWPRHQAIWQSMVHKNVKVHCVPMGVNLDFWKPVDSAGKYAGTPSVMTAENCHYIKWPLDLAIMWPWVCEDFPEAYLHMFYLPNDQHRWWFPWMNANGSAYRAHIASAFKQDKPGLRNAFCSVDYYVNPVRYGDYNRMTLEAKASGCKVISFGGNEYSDFWLTETSQVYQAEQMKAIFSGEIEPRDATPVPSVLDMAKGMKEVYESLF
jgi:hypothetical protein